MFIDYFIQNCTSLSVFNLTLQEMDIQLASTILQMVIMHTFNHSKDRADKVLNLHIRFLGMTNTSIREIVELIENIKDTLKKQDNRSVNFFIKALVQETASQDEVPVDDTLLQLMNKMSQLREGIYNSNRQDNAITSDYGTVDDLLASLCLLKHMRALDIFLKD